MHNWKIYRINMYFDDTKWISASFVSTYLPNYNEIITDIRHRQVVSVKSENTMRTFFT